MNENGITPIPSKYLYLIGQPMITFCGPLAVPPFLLYAFAFVPSLATHIFSHIAFAVTVSYAVPPLSTTVGRSLSRSVFRFFFF